jgi:hypothetical protein
MNEIEIGGVKIEEARAKEVHAFMTEQDRVKTLSTRI